MPLRALDEKLKVLPKLLRINMSGTWMCLTYFIAIKATDVDSVWEHWRSVGKISCQYRVKLLTRFSRDRSSGSTARLTDQPLHPSESQSTEVLCTMILEDVKRDGSEDSREIKTFIHTSTFSQDYCNREVSPTKPSAATLSGVLNLSVHPVAVC